MARDQIEKQFYSLAEFSTAMGISEPTARRLIEDRQVAATRTGSTKSRYLIPVTEVARFKEVAERSRIPAKPADAADVDWEALSTDPNDLSFCDAGTGYVAVPSSVMGIFEAFRKVVRENPALSTEEALTEARTRAHGR
jgi:excisionase family DNA binding protein